MAEDWPQRKNNFVQNRVKRKKFFENIDLISSFKILDI